MILERDYIFWFKPTMKKSPKTKQLRLWKPGGNLCLLRHSSLSRGIFWRHALAHPSLNLQLNSAATWAAAWTWLVHLHLVLVFSPHRKGLRRQRSHVNTVSVQGWGLWKMIMTRWSHHEGRCLMIGSWGYRKEREHRNHTHPRVCTYIPCLSPCGVQHNPRMLSTAWSSSEAATQLQAEQWTKSTSFMHKSPALWYWVIISKTQTNTSHLPSPLRSLWEQRSQSFSLKTWCVLPPTPTPRWF